MERSEASKRSHPEVQVDFQHQAYPGGHPHRVQKVPRPTILRCAERLSRVPLVRPLAQELPSEGQSSIVPQVWSKCRVESSGERTSKEEDTQWVCVPRHPSMPKLPERTCAWQYSLTWAAIKAVFSVEIAAQAILDNAHANEDEFADHCWAYKGPITRSQKRKIDDTDNEPPRKAFFYCNFFFFIMKLIS